MSVYVLATLLAGCSRGVVLTHARVRPPDCRFEAASQVIQCAGRGAAKLACTRWDYEACNVLVLTYADGEAVTLHDLDNDPKFDQVHQVIVSATGDRIWFTEYDLSVRAMLFRENGGVASRARAYDVWAGRLTDDGGEARGDTVAFPPLPSPSGSGGGELDGRPR